MNRRMGLFPLFLMVMSPFLAPYRFGTGLAFAEERVISYKAGSLRMTLNAAGRVQSLLDTGQNKEYLAPGQPAFLISLQLDVKAISPTSLSCNEARDVLTFGFGLSGVGAVVKVAVKGTHITLELDSVQGARPTQVTWGPLPTVIGEHVGPFVGVVRDERFAIGLQVLNVESVGRCGRTTFGSQLSAYATEREGGVKGSKIAVFGCPADKALTTIGEIEVAEGLPHPMLDGVWGKVSPTARLPYLLCGFSEKNLDEILELAQKGGFKYVYDTNPFETWGHFKLDRKRFPDGEESMRRCVERASKRGIRLGCHTLCDFITPNDPYITPVPDPRLARTGSSRLASAVDEKATEIAVADPGPFKDLGVMGTAMIERELVRYSGVSATAPWKLLRCERAAWGTKASAPLFSRFLQMEIAPLLPQLGPLCLGEDPRPLRLAPHPHHLQALIPVTMPLEAARRGVQRMTGVVTGRLGQQVLDLLQARRLRRRPRAVNRPPPHRRRQQIIGIFPISHQPIVINVHLHRLRDLAPVESRVDVPQILEWS